MPQFKDTAARIAFKEDSDHMNLRMRKQTNSVSDTNWPVQSQKQARRLKFWIKEEEGLYDLYSDNKEADQLCNCCTADLHLCFHICRLFAFWCGG